MTPGRCYDSAYRVVDASCGHLVLVHGFPRLLAGEMVDRLFGHAWAETVDGQIAIDAGIVTRAATYYALGRIDPAFVRRYTVEQAREEVLRHETTGPWEIPAGLPEEPLFAESDEPPVRRKRRARS